MVPTSDTKIILANSNITVKNIASVNRKQTIRSQILVEETH